MKKNKIDVIDGFGKLKPGKKLDVTDKDNNFVNNLSKIDKLTDKNEKTILADLNWLYYELPKTYRGQEFRYQNASSWSRNYLSALYREKGNLVLAEIFGESRYSYWNDGNAFYDDDAASGPMADEMGIVMGTSHHEPLTRAHAEWGKANGKWDFNTNSEALIERVIVQSGAINQLQTGRFNKTHQFRMADKFQEIVRAFGHQFQQMLGAKNGKQITFGSFVEGGKYQGGAWRG